MRCEDKRAFRTYKKALKARDQQRKWAEPRGESLRVYVCPRCGLWHLTKHTDWVQF